eukprot:CFRG7814T1
MLRLTRRVTSSFTHVSTVGQSRLIGRAFSVSRLNRATEGKSDDGVTAADDEGLNTAAPLFTPEEEACITLTYDENEKGEKSGVVVVKFNVPDKLNALTEDLGKVFEKRMRQVRGDESVRAMILTGEGKAFSAGGDLKWLTDRTKASETTNQVTMRHFYDRFLSVRRVPVPVISAINGAAVGAGFCLSLATDIRLASESAKMGFNFVRVGIHPGMGGTHFLPLVTNTQVAARLFAVGDLITAKKAQELGIILETFPREELMKNALDMARKIAEGSPSSVRATVQTLRYKQDTAFGGLSAALDWEAECQGRSYAQGDVIEGVASIQEKRTPKF